MAVGQTPSPEAAVRIVPVRLLLQRHLESVGPVGLLASAAPPGLGSPAPPDEIDPIQMDNATSSTEESL